jgi:apurinic endonuclease APN1
MSTLRVRHILANMNANQRAELKKLLPIQASAPDIKTYPYPSAILNSLPKEDSYSILGLAAEEVLRRPVEEITLENLLHAIKRHSASFSEVKARASKTTEPFLECLRTTRRGLDKALRKQEGDLRFEEQVTSGSVEGHPDMRNQTQVFEVKLTGMMKQNWTDFLFQVFAYGALIPEAKDLYLVLPLQKAIWHANIESWKTRGDYLKCLTSWSSNEQTTGLENLIEATHLCNEFCIGHHMHKAKTMEATIQSIQDYTKPYQIFLSGPITAKLHIADEDLAKAKKVVDKTKARVFVHSPYIINLATSEEDKWNTQLLQRNLEYGNAFGSKGVVVHVGKYVKQNPKEALKQMKASMELVLKAATPECPLLLETPAGQGTELLTDREEFLNFVDSFKDPRLGACIDTCHVFASGHDPLDYLKEAFKRKTPVKLVHFNDSLEVCGACKDRHAFVGTGRIGMLKMQQIAALCAEQNVPMVIE